MSKKKYWIETYGCQMNIAESDALILELESRAWTKAESEKEADAVVLNTCTVRKSADSRIWGRLNHYAILKKKRDFKLVVLGCMAQRLKEEIIDRCNAVDLVVGTFDKIALVDFLDNDISDICHTGEVKYDFLESYTKKGSYQSMLPIMHGCDNFCTYCIVPYVRGREISRNPQTIVDEINSNPSIKNLMLLGQNVNSYDYEYNGKKMNFVNLLEFILEKTTVPWIRFMSAHPKDFSNELIELIAREPRICRHIHLPIQHGSNKILELMERKYTVEDYLKIVDSLKEKIPNITLTTDIMLGFPGESIADFEATIDLIKKIKFDDAFTYYYNKREGTKACEMEGHLSREEKQKRLAVLIEIQREISSQIRKKSIGQTVLVLAETVSKKNKKEILARTENNNMVVFEADESLIGDFVKVKITDLSGSTFKGELV